MGRGHTQLTYVSYMIEAVLPSAADGGEGRLLVCCSNAPRGQVCLARWALLLEATIPDGPQIEVSEAWCHKIAQQPCIWQLSNQQLHGRSGGRVGPINMCQFDKWRPVLLL